MTLTEAFSNIEEMLSIPILLFDLTLFIIFFCVSSRFLAGFAGHPAQSVASVDAVAVDRQTQLTLADPHHGFSCVFLVFRNPVEHETVASTVLFETVCLIP